MTQVKEIMHHQTHTVSPRETLLQVAEKMKEHETGVIVVAEGEKIVGIITDRDMVVRCLAHGKDYHRIRVEEAMSFPVVHCMEDDSIEGIAKKMGDARVHRLPVLDHGMKLCGIVSVYNLCVNDPAKGGEVVSKIRK